MYSLKSAWKEAAWVFGLSRLLILLITYIGIVLFPLNGQSSPVNCSASLRPCLLAWYHFDAVAYVYIAHPWLYLPTRYGILPVLAIDGTFWWTAAGWLLSRLVLRRWIAAREYLLLFCARTAVLLAS
jgi:hypothetical protein